MTNQQEDDSRQSRGRRSSPPTYLTIWHLIPIACCYSCCVLGPVNGLNHQYSRRDVYTVAGTVGIGLGYGKVVGEVLSRSAADIRPILYEDRVSATFQWTIAEACSSPPGRPSARTVLRVLELGMGRDCRSIFHSSYNGAIEVVNRGSSNQFSLDITGVDLNMPTPSTLLDAKEKFLRDVSVSSNGKSHEELLREGWNFAFQKEDAQVLSFTDDYFDAVTCSLLLCSVTDQEKALHEIKRVLKPSGTFGYVEHVAVEPGDNRRLFELEQLVFDPLQQAIASNCHLHRVTEASIRNVFGNAFVKKERFFVDGMWPVSCQVLGVIKKS